jgi:hypothetical protein
MSASPTRAGRPRRAGGTAVCGAGSLQEGAELALESGVGGIEEFATRNNDDVQGPVWFVVAEQLAHLAFRAIADDGTANLPGGGDPEPRRRPVGGSYKNGHEPPAYASSRVVGLFEVGPPAYVLGRAKSHRSSETVNRLRPLARRRFNTFWPSLVAIRTRKPCVFLRRRLFG